MPLRTDMAALKARWTAQALEVADKAFSKMDPVAAYQGRPPPFPCVSPFGEIDGRQDFRFLPLGSIPAYRTIEHVDLSSSSNERNGQLSPAQFVNCNFDRASMETNLGEKVYESSFVRAKFTHTTLRGEFVDCDFTQCNLSYSIGLEAKFIRCKFTAAKFIGSRWTHSTFDHCAWDKAVIGNAGLSHCRFIGTWPGPEVLSAALTGGIKYDAGAE